MNKRTALENIIEYKRIVLMVEHRSPKLNVAGSSPAALEKY